VRSIDTWPAGAGHAALLCGPAGSGKTHLAHRLGTRAHAILIDKTKLGALPSAELWEENSCGILEDIHTITEESALFHLLRHAESHGLFLLLTSRLNAKELSFALPDLRSRLLALPVATLALPDDVLLRGFMMKCLADRQLRLGEDVISYLVKRTERSLPALQNMVEKLEQSIAQTHKTITIPFIKSLVDI
jgi:chromosomal replication initiation ATPase DnaA